MSPINRVAIVGGTHGNEFTGAYLVKKFERFPKLVQRSSFETLTILGNPEAFRANRRYIDQDLNRSFLLKDLESPTEAAYEESRAKLINQTLGPKGNPKVDFILDLHTSTANMGFTVILVDENSFNLRLAAYLGLVEPTSKIYRWTEPGKEAAFLNSICDRGFSIEVGPIAQGTLDAALFEKTEALIQAMLDYLDSYNQGEVKDAGNTAMVYQHLKVVDFPKDENGELLGMIHPDLQWQDYQELKPGDPMFLTFDGEAIAYAGETSVYPLFINEAAYYEKGIAMCLTQKTEIELAKQ